VETIRQNEVIRNFFKEEKARQ